MSGTWNFLQIIILVALGIYLMVPLLVRSKQWFSSQPEISEINESQMPDSAREYCRGIGNALEPLGFETMGDVRVHHFCLEQESFVRVFTHPQTHNVAIATEIIQHLPNGKSLNVQFMEFNTEFTDGSELSVTNSDIVKQPGMCSTKKIIPIPMEQDLDSLYRLFRELKIYYGKGDEGRTLQHERLVDEIHESMLAQMECSVKNGYLYHDRNNHQYRLTLKGAYISTLSHMWPFKQIQQSITRKNALKLMAACRSNA